MKQIGIYEKNRNNIYKHLSPSLKIVLTILEQGMETDKKGGIEYSPTKGITWLSKLARDMEGEVSRRTIDEYLDTLLDDGFLTHGDEVMQRVGDTDGTKRWVRAYHLEKEMVPKIIDLYRITHDTS